MNGPMRFDYGDRVRVIRTVRNDGTYPGLETGTKLVRAGSIGHVRNVGTFLQDQVIYTVHFLDEDRHVGCRDVELIGADEPWVETRFEFRSKVVASKSLIAGGETVVNVGDTGEVTRVHRFGFAEPNYDVMFGNRTFRVPETSLSLGADVLMGE